MEHKIYMNYIHPSSLLRQLSVLWRSDQLCDAVITVDKIIVSKAHKLVLYAISPKLCLESKSSSQSPILDVCLPSGVSHKAVHAFLQYMYEGYLILTYDVAPDLLKIARFLEIKCLSNCCSDFVNYMKSKDDPVPVDESDVANETKTEEFEHVRQSSVKEGQLPQKPSQNSQSESKKHKQSDSSEKSVDRTPSSSPFDSHSHSSRHQDGSSAKRKGTLSGDSSGKKRPHLVQGVQSDNVMSDLDLDWGLIKSQGGREIKVENVDDDEDYGEDASMHDRQENQNSFRQTNNNEPIDVDLIEIKEEPEEVLVEQNFLSSISSTSTPGGHNQGQYGDDSMGQMWFSADTGTVQSMNQTAPVPMNSPMGLPQRSMTPSLKQIRAQQSIKRSIQSSVSAARRARNIQMAGASASASASATGEDNQQLDASGEAGGAGSQETIYTCVDCGRVYRTRGSFMSHFSVYHTERVLKCDVCGKEFNKMSNFKRHRNTHLVDKPFACDFCRSSYCSRDGLLYHMKTKHTFFLMEPQPEKKEHEFMGEGMSIDQTVKLMQAVGESEQMDQDITQSVCSEQDEKVKQELIERMKQELSKRGQQDSSERRSRSLYKKMMLKKSEKVISRATEGQSEMQAEGSSQGISVKAEEIVKSASMSADKNEMVLRPRRQDQHVWLKEKLYDSSEDAE